MTFSDFLRLMRHYLKLVIAIPLVCAVVSIAAVVLTPSTYIAKAALLTGGDVPLAAGFAQSEAAVFSQNEITVSVSTDSSYRTVTIEAEGNDYDGCIAAVNATVLAAAEDCRTATPGISVTANEATWAESSSPSIPKSGFIALVAGLFIAICVVLIIDSMKAPIKSKRDVEETTGLSVIGAIPNRDRGERLLANIRFLSDEQPRSIAVIPVGFTGATLTCAELAGAFDNAGFAVSRVQGSPHAQGIKTVDIPGVISIIECMPLNEGVGAVYIAREADLTVVCVNEWIDSSKDLREVVEELKFAKANIAGVVYLSTRYLNKE